MHHPITIATSLYLLSHKVVEECILRVGSLLDNRVIMETQPSPHRTGQIALAQTPRPTLVSHHLLLLLVQALGPPQCLILLVNYDLLGPDMHLSNNTQVSQTPLVEGLYPLPPRARDRPTLKQALP